MHEDEPLGPGNVSYLASLVADGTATACDARRLIVEFVRQADTGTISPRLIEHLRDCFSSFLTGRKRILPSGERGRDMPVWVPIKTLEKAFGLTRISSGQPPVDSDTRTAAAMQLLEQRLEGIAHQEALANVAAARKTDGLPVSSETEVGAAWAAHKLDALVWLRISRTGHTGGGWTRDELDRLTEIYADTPDAVLPSVGDMTTSDAPENPQDKPA